MKTVRGLLAVALLFAPGVARADVLASARALVRAVRASGRAEATVRYTITNPLGGPARAVRARLVLEPPDLAGLDVESGGERIVLRRDGGEWLQPGERQLLRLRPGHAVAALRWWRVLLGDEGTARETPAGVRRWRVAVPATAEAPAETALVVVDGRGLPARLEVGSRADGAVVYELGGWRFTRPRGEPAFHLALPRGFEAVELP